MASRVVAILFICFLGGQEVSAIRSSKAIRDSYEETTRMKDYATIGLDLGSNACDKEAFVMEHQGIVDEVEKLANDCKEAAEETEEFAQSGVKMKAKCAGRDVDVSTLIKRVNKFQALFQASKTCAWAEDVAKEIHAKGFASKVGANLRYIYENAPEIDDDARSKFTFKFEEIEGFKSSAKTVEQFQTDAQEAAARFGPSQKSLSELKAMKHSHEIKVASDSDSEVADELVAGNPCWRQRRLFKNSFKTNTGCGKQRGCFQLDFGSESARKDKANRPTDDDMLKANLVNGSRSAFREGVGVKKNEYETWGICLPKTKGKDGVYRGFAAWKRGVEMAKDVAKAFVDKQGQGGSFLESNRSDTQFIGSLTAGIASYSIMLVILTVAYAIWIPMQILELGIGAVSFVGWLLLFWFPVWWIAWVALIFVWCLAKAVIGLVLVTGLTIIFLVGLLFALVAAGLDSLIGFELHALENYSALGLVGLALSSLAFSCDAISQGEES